MRTFALILAAIFLLLVLLGLGGWLYLRAPDIPAATLEAKYARANSHYADLGGGMPDLGAQSLPSPGGAVGGVRGVLGR